jgi:beta-galactosidase
MSEQIQTNSPRQRFLMDPGWRFYLGEPPFTPPEENPDHFPNANTRPVAGPAGPEYDDSAWRLLDLPHDWAVEGAFDPAENPQHGSLPTGVGWYRKSFNLPVEDQGKKLYLEFDGAFRDSTVWVNGFRMGNVASGYSSFRYDISDVANYGGANLIAVRLDAAGFEGWWYEGAGLYRHVWLLKTSALHVMPWGVFVRVEPLEGLHSWKVLVHTTLANHTSQAVDCTLESTIVDASGQRLISGPLELALSEAEVYEVKQPATVVDPHLWSVDDPYLYRMFTTLRLGETVVDSCETTFGFRSIRFDPDQGFFLNEKPLKLKGTCNHQDHAGVGVAVPDRLYEFRIKRLKEMGSNAYRCAHNPPAPELLDACDRLGMLVIDETRRMDSNPDGLFQLESLLRRDRNHPCIILWGLGNEEPIQKTEPGARILASMKRLVRQMDPTRPVILAMNGGWGSPTSEALDVQGFNYNIAEYDPFHQKFPTKPCVVTESGSTVGTRNIYEIVPELGYVSAYDINNLPWPATAEETWKAAAERPFISGTFVWTGFDYRGEPTPYVWPCINSHFGIMDTCGFPKDNYYYYQAWWSSQVVLHLFPAWNWTGYEGEPIQVWCHSNCDEVELLLNGASLGKQSMPLNGHVEWHLAYSPGVLAARGFKNGQEAATTERKTTGPASCIALLPDRPTILADGEDVVVVNVAIQDEEGLTIPVARNLVRFSIEGAGKILGVGNGDPSCHETDRASQRSAFGGLCQVILQASTEPGKIVLSAESDGLEPARLVIKAEKAVIRLRL